MDLDQRPLTFISPRTVDLLATFLDVRKILPTESGYLRDYRGLMDGARFNYQDTQRVEASSSHKTGKETNFSVHFPLLSCFSSILVQFLQSVSDHQSQLAMMS